MKKTYIIILLMIITFAISCKSVTNIQMSVGDVIRLTEQKAFRSSDETIVTIDENRVMSAINPGICDIYVNDDVKYTVVVSLNKNAEINISTKQTLKVGEKVTLEPTINKNSFDYILHTNDKNIININENTIEALSVGIATVTIVNIDNENITKEVLFYVYDENADGSILTNIIEHREYEITGNFDLTYLNNKICALVDEYKDSIIGVSNFQEVYSFFTGSQIVENNVGTGFIYKKQNNRYYAITNNHVVENNKYLKVYFGYTNEYVDCTLEAFDATLDLAVVSFESSKDLKVLKLTNEKVSVGDFAIAIGNANGYDYFGTTTFGIISYVDRKIEGESSVYLQHDVAINPGNSGGPLFDINGNVIGVNTLKIVDSSVDNIGFSINITTVNEFLNKYKMS